jgi:hypothetical protein
LAEQLEAKRGMRTTGGEGQWKGDGISGFEIHVWLKNNTEHFIIHCYISVIA